VEFEKSARRDANRRNGWSLRMSGNRKQTEKTQNGSEGMAHGLGLSSTEKREQHNYINFARIRGQRERRLRVANASMGLSFCETKMRDANPNLLREAQGRWQQL